MDVFSESDLKRIIESPRRSLRDFPQQLRKRVNFAWFLNNISNPEDNRVDHIEEILLYSIPREMSAPRKSFLNDTWMKKVDVSRRLGINIYRDILIWEQASPAATYIKLSVCEGTPPMDYYSDRKGRTIGWYYTYDKNTMILSVAGGRDHPFDACCQSHIQTYPGKQKIRTLQALLLPLIRHCTTLEDAASDSENTHYYLGLDPLGKKYMEDHHWYF